MGNRICDQKNREYIDAKQNYKAYGDRGGIGDRAGNLVELIGAERVSRRNYGYDGTYRDWETDRKSTRLNSSHSAKSRMPSSA